MEKVFVPQSDMVNDLVKLDERGRIIVDCSNCSNIPGLLDAGEITNDYAEQVLTSIGEGAKVALRAYENLLPILELIHENTSRVSSM